MTPTFTILSALNHLIKLLEFVQESSGNFSFKLAQRELSRHSYFLVKFLKEEKKQHQCVREYPYFNERVIKYGNHPDDLLSVFLDFNPPSLPCDWQRFVEIFCFDMMGLYCNSLFNCQNRDRELTSNERTQVSKYIVKAFKVAFNSQCIFKYCTAHAQYTHDHDFICKMFEYLDDSNKTNVLSIWLDTILAANCQSHDSHMTDFASFCKIKHKAILKDCSYILSAVCMDAYGFTFDQGIMVDNCTSNFQAFLDLLVKYRLGQSGFDSTCDHCDVDSGKNLKHLIMDDDLQLIFTNECHSENMEVVDSVIHGKQKQAWLPIISIAFDGITCFARMSDLKYPIECYGFADFGCKVGYSGVIDIISAYMYYFLPIGVPSPKILARKTSSANNIRYIRTSMFFFANNINNIYNINNTDIYIDDGAFWQAIAMVTLGLFSFHYINIEKIKEEKNTTMNLHNGIKFIEYIRNYLQKYVIDNIEPYLHLIYETENTSLITILKNAVWVLQLCYAMIGDKTKYRLMETHVRVCGVKSVLIKNGSKLILEMSSLLELRTNYFNCCSQWKQVCTILDKFCHVITSIDRYDSNSDLVHYQHENDHDDNIMMAYHKKFHNMIEHIIDDRTRQDTLFLQWKNTISHKNCNYCNKKCVVLRKCARCMKVFYCSKYCQKRDWKFGDHRHKCGN